MVCPQDHVSARSSLAAETGDIEPTTVRPILASTRWFGSPVGSKTQYTRVGLLGCRWFDPGSWVLFVFLLPAGDLCSWLLSMRIRMAPT